MNLRNSRPLEVPIRWLARGVGICPFPPSLVSQGLQPHLSPRQPPSLTSAAERNRMRGLDKSRQHHDSEQIGLCAEYFKMYTLP